MTIKTRNRINLGLFSLAILYAALNLAGLLIKLLTGSLSFETFSGFINESTFILFRYSPYCVVGTIFIQLAFVISNSYVLFHGFEKTQASDIVYYTIFLFALLADTTRLWIPLLNLAESFSKLYFFCGNVTIFSSLLIPLSLLSTIILGEIEQRTDTERNIFILLLVSFFFAEFIPLNSAVICKNFSVDYSYKRLLSITSVMLLVIGVFSLAIRNKKKLFSQKTTAGFLLICIGALLFENSTNIFLMIVCTAVNATGSALFLKTLHRQYLWN